MVETTVGGQDLVLRPHRLLQTVLLDMDTLQRQLLLGLHVTPEGIKGVQESYRKGRTRPHTASRGKIRVMMDLQTAIHLEKA